MNGVDCFYGFVTDSGLLTLSVFSFFLAITTLIILKKTKLSTKQRISLIYIHLTTLFFPFVLFTVKMSCGLMSISCYYSPIHLVSYALPANLTIAIFTGFIIIPNFYISMNKKRKIKNKHIIDFVRKYSKKLNIPMPRLYAVDKASPLAFSFRSFRSAIFMSVGLFDILNKKELEAVLLHELAHIKQYSSILKVSNSFLKFLSPLSILTRFHYDSNDEEKQADDFMIKTQKTSKFLKSAKMKINIFNS